MKNQIEKANILAEALPYIQLWRDKTVVIKYGGNAMDSEVVQNTILQDIAMLKICGVNPVLVHGGGPDINAMLDKLQIKSSFHKGLRITDKPAMDVVQMVLCGKLNKDLTSKICSLNVKAIGLSGKDADLIKVEKKQSQDGVDLGFVGEIKSVNTKLLNHLIADYIPVIASVGTDDKGNSYNINADTAAAEIAAALNAEKLVFLTDIDGIRANPDDENSLISVISVDKINQMIESGSISGGMIPKVMACVRAIEMGIARTHIINGKMQHPIMLELFTDHGIGTMVTK